MKKVIKSNAKLLLVLFILVALVTPNIAFADEFDWGAVGVGCVTGTGAGALIGGVGAVPGGIIGCTLGLAAAAIKSIGGVMGVLAIIAGAIASAIAYIVFIVEFLLNIVVKELVLEMGNIIRGSTGVVSAWTTVRDLANIGIIGGLVAVAIGTILQIEKYAAKQLLARLIIAAILVNFSYFFAATIIDASNYLAGVAYSQICGGKSCQEINLSAEIRKMTQWPAFEAYKSQPERIVGITTTAPADSVMAAFLFNVSLVVLEFIILFVLLSIIALLIGRFVALTFLLIASPLGIAGVAIPGLQKYVVQWWQVLFAQAFFAPIFFLLVAFSINIMKQVSATVSTGTPVHNIILSTIVGAALMLASLRAAKTLSAVGANYVGGAYTGAARLTGWMPGMYTRGLKYLGSTAGTETVGRLGDVAGRWYQQRIASKYRLDKIPIVATIDRGIQKGFDTMKGAKFGGKVGYGETKEIRKGRGIQLAATKDEMDKRDKLFKEALPKLNKARAEYDKLIHDPNERQKGESLWTFEQRMRKKSGLDQAKLETGSIINSLPDGAIGRIYDEDPDKYARLAPAMTDEEFLSEMGSAKVRKDIKEQMRNDRYGDFVGRAQEYQARIDSGEVRRGSQEYKDMKFNLHQWQKKIIRNNPALTDMLLSTTGQPLRGNDLFWASATNGFYRENQKDNKFSVEERKKDRGRYRADNYLDAHAKWAGAQIIGGTTGELGVSRVGDSQYKPEAESREWAVRLKENSEKVLQNQQSSSEDKAKAEKDRRFAGAVLGDASIGRELEREAELRSISTQQLLKNMADEYQKEAEGEMREWEDGKQPHESAASFRDRSLFHPLLAIGMTSEKLNVIANDPDLSQDPNFKKQLQYNVLRYGGVDEESAIQWMFLNEEGQTKYGPPPPDVLADTEKDRARKGMKSIAQIIEEGKVAYGLKGSETNSKQP